MKRRSAHLVMAENDHRLLAGAIAGLAEFHERQ